MDDDDISPSPAAQDSDLLGAMASQNQTTKRSPIVESPSAGEQSPQRSRRRTYGGNDAILESTWASLDVFNRTNRGRLMSLEPRGDALDNFISSTAEKTRAAVSARIAQDSPDALLHLSASPATAAAVAAQQHFGSFETDDNQSDDICAENFAIPELPEGSLLTFNILSSWGDKHYIGLNGIEVYSAEGQLVDIANISANPPDINILPEYDSDPRVVKNLIDGINRTRDDAHVWLAPFTPGENHIIRMAFNKRTRIAMIRIWVCFPNLHLFKNFFNFFFNSF